MGENSGGGDIVSMRVEIFVFILILALAVFVIVIARTIVPMLASTGTAKASLVTALSASYMNVLSLADSGKIWFNTSGVYTVEVEKVGGLSNRIRVAFTDNGAEKTTGWLPFTARLEPDQGKISVRDAGYISMEKGVGEGVSISRGDPLKPLIPADIPGSCQKVTEGWLAIYVPKIADEFHLEEPYLRANIAAESGLRHCDNDGNVLKDPNPKADSLGIFQLTSAAAGDVGVEKMQRYDPYWNIWGGAKYLKKYLNVYKNYPDSKLIAAAVYNCGPGNIRALVGISGCTEGQTCWEKILPNLSKECTASVTEARVRRTACYEDCYTKNPSCYNIQCCPTCG